MKLSEIMLLMIIKVFKLMEEVGVLKGVVNFVFGLGVIVGDEFVVNKDVDLILFMGGIEIGKKIMQVVSGNVKKIVFEFGGKNLNIVFKDVDLEVVVDQVLNVVFFYVG